MLSYILKRLLLTLPTLSLVSLAVFLLIRLIPGDPALVLLGEGADAAALAGVRADLGLDHPLPVQFVSWLQHALRGDLGRSIVSGEPVAGLILQRFGLTAAVVLVAVTAATVIAASAGLIAAWRRNSAIDLAVVGAATVVLAIPSFWLGMVLLLLFGLKLGWLPFVGYIPFSESAMQAMLFLVMPVMTLTITESGVLTRMMRSSSIDVLQLDYVTHARAKGLSERVVLTRHVFPNAFAPTLTLVGLTLGHLLGGIAVIETVFTLPGLGRLMVDSVLARDYPVVQGCLLFTAVVYVVVNLLVDLCYPLFDPRVTAR
ncbi:MAG: binding-protein-dependent transport system inner rane component [Gammaproteobacteria bacterium]|jgi:peptide/nickel transport system permease protein|nr:binding-protein-dependent transport system inner rane component [Gammaproteobacteria bacterium]HEV7442072.1 ABC transporter permease [Steroidobacteraceae bacterium]